MGLPSGSIAWPPKQIAPLHDDIATWAAWYSGDPDELYAAYWGRADKRRDPIAQNRRAQYAGGVVGTVARWFWGQPTPINQQRTKLHVPVAADIATASSDLLFAEQPQIVTDEADSTARARLDKILEGVRWESLLPEAGETAAAMTGVFLRIVWDSDVADHPLITVVQPDAAWPEFVFGRLRAVTFWHVVERRQNVIIRHLERHERGRILHGLYEGTSDKLGRVIPLTESAATAGLTVDAEGGIPTGTDRLTAVYVPNVLPQRRKKWRADPIGVNLGRSDLDGIEPELDALDEVYTSWMRDIRLGKSRILADSTALETNGRGQGANLDLDREVFVGLNLMGDGDSAPITSQQFDIRATDHQATAEAILKVIVSGAGYSPQTFGIDADGAAVTATEVNARESKSKTTREKKTRYWTPELTHLLHALCEVDAHVFNGGARFTEPITVEFPPAGQPAMFELAQTAQQLKAAQAASTKTLVQLVHPDWSEPQVLVETDSILAENSFTIPDIPVPEARDREPEREE